MDATVWLRSERARYSYRPGWYLSIEWPASFDSHDLPKLVVNYRANDSNDPERIIDLTFRTIIPPAVVEGCDPDLFAEWLRHVLLHVEEHELDEWLRRDRIRVSDPHTRSDP